MDSASENFQALWQKRSRALAAFESWREERDVADRPPHETLAVAAGLYELLPPDARHRPIDTGGIRELHRQLAVLGRSR